MTEGLKVRLRVQTPFCRQRESTEKAKKSKSAGPLLSCLPLPASVSPSAFLQSLPAQPSTPSPGSELILSYLEDRSKGGQAKGTALFWNWSVHSLTNLAEPYSSYALAQSLREPLLPGFSLLHHP